MAVPALLQRDFSRVIGDGAEDLERRGEESGVSVNEASERKPDKDGRMMWPCNETKDKLKGTQKERNVGKLETRRLRGHFKTIRLQDSVSEGANESDAWILVLYLEAEKNTRLLSGFFGVNLPGIDTGQFGKRSRGYESHLIAAES